MIRHALLVVIYCYLLTIPGDALQRYKLHDKLVKMEANYLQKWDKMKVVFKDEKSKYEARQIWEGDVPLTIIKYKADGLDIEQFRHFYDDPVAT